MLGDTLGRPGSKRREPIIFLICLSGAGFLVFAGIILQGSRDSDLLIQLAGALLLAAVLYLGTVILRVLYSLISRFWFRK